MTYNTQDTIYYKSAKKLLGYGRKILSVEKIQLLRGHLPFTITISPEEFGFDMNSDSNGAESPTEAGAERKSGDRETDRDTADSDGDSGSDDDADVSRVIEDIREVVRRPPGRFEAIPDDLTAQEVADQAAAAAKGAAEKLKKPPEGIENGLLETTSRWHYKFEHYYWRIWCYTWYGKRQACPSGVIIGEGEARDRINPGISRRQAQRVESSLSIVLWCI